MPNDFDLASAQPIQDNGFDLSSAHPIDSHSVLPRAISNAVFDTVTGFVRPLMTPEARGVGQAALQGSTFGYGLPMARNAIQGAMDIGAMAQGKSSQPVTLPRPTTREQLVGSALSIPVGSGQLSAGMQAAGKLAPIIPMAAGYAYNPSDTDIAPANSGSRLIGAGVAGLGQAVGAGINAVKGYINPQAIDALKRAIKPGKWNKNFDSDAAIAMPAIKEAGVQVHSMDDFVDATAQAKKNVWGMIQGALDKAQGALKYVTKQVTEEIPSRLVDKFNRPIMNKVTKDVDVLTNGVNGDEIVSGMEGIINPASEKLSPEYGSAIRAVAKKYEGNQITIEEAEDRLQKLNAGLTSYFKASERGAYVRGQESNIAADLAERKILRQELYKKIESLSGEGVAKLKKQYGALMNIQDEALGRVNVSNRQNPVSLQEALNGVAGITELFGGNPLGIVRIAGAGAVKKLNSANYLIRKAVNNYGETPANTIPYITNTGIQLGQIVTHSNGSNAKVVGFDTDGHPLVEPE